MGYEVNICPFDVGQLSIARSVLEWAVNQDDRLHNSINSQNVVDAIDNVIMNEIITQLRIKRLEDYSTEEIEQELNKRYHGQK